MSPEMSAGRQMRQMAPCVKYLLRAKRMAAMWRQLDKKFCNVKQYYFTIQSYCIISAWRCVQRHMKRFCCWAASFFESRAVFQSENSPGRIFPNEKNLQSICFESRVVFQSEEFARANFCSFPSFSYYY